MVLGCTEAQDGFPNMKVRSPRLCRISCLIIGTAPRRCRLRGQGMAATGKPICGFADYLTPFRRMAFPGLSLRLVLVRRRGRTDYRRHFPDHAVGLA